MATVTREGKQIRPSWKYNDSTSAEWCLLEMMEAVRNTCEEIRDAITDAEEALCPTVFRAMEDINRIRVNTTKKRKRKKVSHA